MEPMECPVCPDWRALQDPQARPETPDSKDLEETPVSEARIRQELRVLRVTQAKTEFLDNRVFLVKAA